MATATKKRAGGDGKRAKLKQKEEIVSKPAVVAEVKPHSWTDDGSKVLILRRCGPDGLSYNQFQWPTSGPVEAKDFNPKPVCGGGLHGWPWGMGLGEGADYSIIDDLWIVFASDPKDVVGEIDGGSKCKVKCGDVVYAGNFSSAWAMINSGRHRLIDAMAKGGSSGASSGNYSTAASSGVSSTAGSSGASSTAASSGNYSKAASSGNYSKAASSGVSSTAASSGNYSTAASSGDYSKAASSGVSSTAASSGDYSTAGSSGVSSTAASSGVSSTAASSGVSSTAASSGNYSKAASSGNYSKAASSGVSSTAASSGNYSTAASSGDYSKAASSGVSGIAATIGHGGRVKAGINGLIFESYWVDAEKRYRGVVGNVGEDGIMPDVWYEVKDGKFCEVQK